jgi:hypothetical protein
MEEGLRIEIEDQPGATVILYKKLDQRIFVLM